MYVYPLKISEMKATWGGETYRMSTFIFFVWLKRMTMAAVPPTRVTFALIQI